MRVAVDATPLLGQRSGVGRYLQGLLDGLHHLPGAPEPVLTLFSIRGRVPEPLPPGTSLAPRRAPARLLNRAWRRMPFPPVELLTGRVDVFHATNFVLPPLARAAGVVTVHDLTYLRFPETVDDEVRAYRHLVPSAIRRAAQVVTVSAAMAEEVVAEYAVEPERLTVTPLGVDGEWASAVPPSADRRARLGLPERYVLFAGNREPRKNLGTLLRAHAAARRTDPDVPRLVVVGPAGWGDAWGGERPDEVDVVLLGYLADEDLRAVVAGADAVCSPSVYEGFGLPVLEAMATGTPVLASDIPAHREVAGGLATLLPTRDADAWSDALLGVRPVSDRDATGVSERRARAGSYTWDACAARHLEAYESAVRGHSDGPVRRLQ
jgi:glycosyltransferase involved in cell wall biosynthesis